MKGEAKYKNGKIFGAGIITQAILIVLFLSSCVSTVSCPPQPDWISSPESPGYYVGVGSADSGNQAEDRPVAESRARADLASRISVQISSELSVETESSSRGDYEQQVKELVNQSVEKNIQDIETVDTYYCREMGTWVYVRLSREKWEAIQAARRAEVLERVKDLLDPVLSDSRSSLATRLDRLNRSYELISESTMGTKIMGEIAGNSGNISDIVRSLLNAHIGGLQIELDQAVFSLEVGTPLSVRGRLTSGQAGTTGVIEMTAVDREGRVRSTIQTDNSGFFNLQFPEGFSETGELALLIQPAGLFSSPIGRRAVQGEVPAAEIMIQVEKLTAGLLVRFDGDETGRTIVNEMRALFSDQDLPFQFSSEVQNEGFNLIISVFIEDFPRVIENAPLMSRSWAVVNLEKNGKSIYSYESQSVKDGGINIDQAHSRVLNKLLQEMRKDRELFGKLKTVLDEI